MALLLALGATRDLWRAHALARAARERSVPAADSVAHAGAAGDSAAPRGLAERDHASRGARPPVDLNRSDARALDTLPGVGPVLAGRIVRERRRAGRFESVEDLLAVPGVGPRLLERIRPFVALGPDSTPAAPR